MRIAYIDLVSGASGDMLLGALVDAGLPFDQLQHALDALRLPGFELTREQVMRGAFAATKADVHITDHATSRHLADIEAVLDASDLAAGVRERARRIFRRMIEVEAKIHNIPVEAAHLHELGALDTIADVVGVLLGFDLLGVQEIVVSPVPLGRGTLKTSHGQMPLPAPATLALLQGAPVIGVEHAVETVTPTAAALLTDLASGFGPIPAMRLAAIGYGAGGRTIPEPNIVRLLVGEAIESEPDKSETLVLLETNIDDMNPEVYGYVIERLLAEGTLDAYLTPVVMKKNRPGIVLSVLCRPQDEAALRALVFAETTTLGIRSQRVARHALPRSTVRVETPHGPIQVKVSRWGENEKAAPEYEDCRRVAQAAGVPLRQVYEAALAAYRTSSARST
jgi:uncharacterized protein (TIGR00299 family) protein